MLGSGSVAALQLRNSVSAVLVAVGPGAVATAILPHFSTARPSSRDGIDPPHSLRSYAAIILAVTMPAIAMLMLFSEPLVRLFFERGQFTGAATGGDHGATFRATADSVRRW